MAASQSLSGRTPAQRLAGPFVIVRVLPLACCVLHIRNAVKQVGKDGALCLTAVGCLYVNAQTFKAGVDALSQGDTKSGWAMIGVSLVGGGISSTMVKQELSTVKNAVGNIGKNGVNGATKIGGTVELFTDARGPQVSGAVGVGPKDPFAVGADARNIPNIPSNSQARVVANNHFIPKSSGGTGTIMDFLPEAQRITQPGGKIVINMSSANPNFKSFPTENQLRQMGFRVEYQGNLLPEFNKFNFQRLDGSLIPNNTMKTIVLLKE